MESCKCPLHIYSKQHVHPDRKDMVGLLSLRRPFAPPGRQQGLRGSALLRGIGTRLGLCFSAESVQDWVCASVLVDTGALEGADLEPRR